MTGGPSTFLRHFGQGASAAVALHCTLGHGGAWRGVGAAVGHRLTLTAPDLPAHGRSADWDGITDLGDACTDAVRALLAKPVHLIGHSFGAVIALRLAVEMPDQVRSLTLIEPVLFAVARADAPDVFATHIQDAAPCMEALDGNHTERATRLFNRQWGDGRSWAGYPAKLRGYMTERMPLVAAQHAFLFEDHAGLLVPERLARVTMPTLLLEGTGSPRIIACIQKGLATRLARSERHVIEGASHMLPLTHPKEVAKAILEHSEIA